jgi:Succinylglutamate desuccinylase / Aspartoacylase family
MRTGAYDGPGSDYFQGVDERRPRVTCPMAAVPLAFNLDRYLARIRAFDGARFEVATEATVPYRDREHPILAVRSRTVAAKTLLVLAGVHGDEAAGLLAVPPILEAWRSERVRLVVITPVNPVGAAKGSRFNAAGQDINRDFVRFATPEARVVRDVFEQDRPDFVISLHEGPQDGTFMFANRFVETPLAHALCDALAAGGTVLATKDYFGLRLHPPGLSPASATTRAVWKLWALALRKKASIAYSEDRRVPEIVLESSWRMTDEAARVRAHVDLVAAVAQRI